MIFFTNHFWYNLRGLNLEPPDIVSTEDTTVALCAKSELKEEIAQATRTDRTESLNSKRKDTLDHKGLF